MHQIQASWHPASWLRTADQPASQWLLAALESDLSLTDTPKEELAFWREFPFQSISDTAQWLEGGCDWEAHVQTDLLRAWGLQGTYDCLLCSNQNGSRKWMHATDTEWENSGTWCWLRCYRAKKSIIILKQQLRYLSSLTSEPVTRQNDYRSDLRQSIQTSGLRPWKTCLTALDMTIYFLLWLSHALYMEIQVNIGGRTLGKTHKHNSVIVIHDHQVPSSAIHGIQIGVIYPQGCLCFFCGSNVKHPS